MPTRIQRIPITNKADWLTLRRRDFTASEAGTLFGCHPFRTILTTYAEKTGMSRGQGDNPAMRRGRIMEPGIAVAVMEDQPDWQLEKVTDYIRAPELRIAATLDYVRVLNDGGVEPVEMKSVSPEVFERDWKNGAPLCYQLQTLVQVMLTDARRGWVACLVDTRMKDLYLYEVARVEPAWQKIVDAVAGFWEDVAARRIPKADYARDADAIRDLFPTDDGTRIDLSADNMLPEMLAEWQQLKAVEKSTAARIEEITTEVKHKMGSHAEASLRGFRITCKSQSRKEHVVKATTFRKLTITTLKEETAPDDY